MLLSKNVSFYHLNTKNNIRVIIYIYISEKNYRDNVMLGLKWDISVLYGTSSYPKNRTKEKVVLLKLFLYYNFYFCYLYSKLVYEVFYFSYG